MSGCNVDPTVVAQGTNTRGNQWCRHSDSSGATSYHYNNRDGTTYHQNNDGSSVFDNGRGFSFYRPPPATTEESPSQGIIGK
ncbi:hypothetical protein EDD85DRAFT_832190 [Armillaria nabsnona]|nr:hypothetical protein EDD85DRAFT_832190 [Armillaria nabsnona]